MRGGFLGEAVSEMKLNVSLGVGEDVWVGGKRCSHLDKGASMYNSREKGSVYLQKLNIPQFGG